MESDPVTAFVDDTCASTIGDQAVEQARDILALVEIWEPWAGIRVNCEKSRCMAIDFATNRPVDTSRIQYRGNPLKAQRPTEPFKYLGVRLTLTRDFTHEKKRIIDATVERVEKVIRAKFLSPTQRELVVQYAIVPKFQYSAGLVPWTLTELEDLTKVWVRAYRGLWSLPPSADSSLFRLSPKHGGRGCPSALGVWCIEAASLVTQCLRVPGTISQLMLANLQRACISRGCTTLYQLQRMLRLVRKPTEWVDLLVSRLDGLGFDITTILWPAPKLEATLISQVIWTQEWKRRAAIERQQSQPHLPTEHVKSLGALARSGIWFAAQLYLGAGCWKDYRDVRAPGLSERGYNRILQWLQNYQDLARFDMERRTLPGLRQLTLWEAPSHRPDRQMENHSRCSHVSNHTDWRTQCPRQHPWHSQPRLPNLVEFDITSDLPYEWPSPKGTQWTTIQRNGRLIISCPQKSITQLEAAQAHMLRRLTPHLPHDDFLNAVARSSKAQTLHDSTRAVHWSRHLLAALERATGARGLVGCRAVTRHPHYWWYSSPDALDSELGSVTDWPREGCILILDAFPPDEHETILRRAFGHDDLVWIIRLDEPSAVCKTDREILHRLKRDYTSGCPRKAI